jgi:hypothetical protein
MWEQQPASSTHFQDAALMYDWNQVPPLTCQFERPEQVELNDETLRDGLQCPSVLQPTLEQKLALLRLLPRLGIGSADIGYPGASTAALEDVAALAKTIQAERLPVVPNCAGRTHEADITPVSEAQQRSGQAIEAALFIGSSPIRQFVGGWDISSLLKTIEASVSYARRSGLTVMFVTEDTTRARPEHLAAMYLTAARVGATRLCLAGRSRLQRCSRLPGWEAPGHYRGADEWTGKRDSLAARSRDRSDAAACRADFAGCQTERVCTG